MPAFRPGKPRFRAGLSADTAFAAGLHVIDWDSITIDDVSGYDGAGAYTMDRDGLILTAAQIRRATGVTAAVATLNLRVNGTNVISGSSPNLANAANCTLTTMLEVAEGDVLDVTANLHPTTAGSLVATQSGWWIVRVGPKRWV